MLESRENLMPGRAGIKEMGAGISIDLVWMWGGHSGFPDT
jgi:hypothetical protein